MVSHLLNYLQRYQIRGWWLFGQALNELQPKVSEAGDCVVSHLLNYLPRYQRMVVVWSVTYCITSQGIRGWWLFCQSLTELPPKVSEDGGCLVGHLLNLPQGIRGWWLFGQALTELPPKVSENGGCLVRHLLNYLPRCQKMVVV